MLRYGSPDAAGAAVSRTKDVLLAGQAVAAARVEQAESFLRHRVMVATDGQAHAMSIVETKSQLDNALAEWEADVFAVHPPDDLEPLRVALLGSTKEALDEIAALPDHLAAAVRKGKEHTGPEPVVYKIHLELRFTRGKVISETIEQLKKSAAWWE